MTEARQIISDLETSKTYLVRAEVVDKNLGVVVGESVAVVATPADSSIPGEIDSTTPGAFLLFSNSKSVMFRFNAPLDKDISGYDYEIYAANSLSGLLLASGQSYTTVFTVILDNTEAVPADLEGPPKIFYGRVRAFDTSGNKGSYTPLIASKPTLVDSAEISDLTATKIKAGTITSSIINLDGANSVIRSSNYTTGTDGWAIRGDGTAEFSAGVIRGTVKAGSLFIDANNRWKSDTTGATISIPEFKVGSSTQYVSWDGNTLTVQGTLKFPDGSTPVDEEEAEEAAESVITSGFVGGLTIQSDKMYYGAGLFASSNTGFYVANNGGATNFSLGDKLTWNGSTLSISGNVVITGGSTLDAINNAQTTANNANNIASTAIQPGSLEARIGDSVTSINGGKIATGTLNADKITAGTLSASQISTGTLSADFIAGGTIDASNINGVSITGTTISGSSIQVGGRILLPIDGGQIKLGTDSGGSATQCTIYAGGDQGILIETSSNGSMWIAGQSLYPNLTQFTSGRYIVGLVTDFGNGTRLVVSNQHVYREGSKRELKENIQDFNNISLIDGLRPRTFTWKALKNRKEKNNEETEEQKLKRESAIHIGFIAEEVEEASDGLLSIYNDEEDGDGEVIMYKQLDILALAVANIQDLRRRVADLENS